MSNPGQYAHELYGDARQGTADVSQRLTDNTRRGTLDFTEALRQRLDLRDGLDVLDVGCGPGHHLAAFLEDHAIGAYGVDPFLAAQPAPGLKFSRGRAENLPFPNCSFDRVVCNYALYYVDPWKRALDEMLRVLRAGGRVLLTGPDADNNEALYSLHRGLFGEISEIDQRALGFLTRHAVPYFKALGLDLTVETLDNEIHYPTADAFLEYYTATTLFRIATQHRDPKAMTEAVRQILGEDGFDNTKRITVVRVDLPGAG